MYAGSDAPPFKAGFAERDITPEIGCEAPGGYGKSYHRSLHDPCKVRVAVFDDGKNRIALVGLDALFIHRQTVQNVRKAIAAKTGIPEGSILLGASHSHSSGPMSGVMPGEYDHAPELVRRLAYQRLHLRRCEIPGEGRKSHRRGGLPGRRVPRRRPRRHRQGDREDGGL